MKILTESYNDIGLLVLRVSTGATMLLAHGWGKWANFAAVSAKFPDPLGVGSELSLALAVFAEVVCAALLVLGLGTRLAIVPLIVTMVVAAFIVHADDPFQQKELALMYLFAFGAIFFSGAGKYSLDAVIFKGKDSQ